MVRQLSQPKLWITDVGLQPIGKARGPMSTQSPRPGFGPLGGLDIHMLMTRLIRMLVAVSSGPLLSGCDRLDPLAVIDSPDGKAVLLDSVAVRSGDRVICVRSNVKQPCSRATAEVVVLGGGANADVDPRWAGNRRVTIAVVRGKLEKSAPTALNGRISLEYR